MKDCIKEAHLKQRIYASLSGQKEPKSWSAKMPAYAGTSLESKKNKS